ncbi:unnamed protein product [Cladocopium goreaui]|uniref:Tyr recombinase domain-containing protein n=1 Tax=Cladocopium goreaui TaxID=2562237 RepID=A0A9P1FKD4_9DINO|nr:unnamed protein product [Cladocopium goreaui]
MWTVVRPVALSVAAPVLGGGARRAPAGIPQGAVNWICVPPACDQQWNPDVVEVVALTQEANRFVAHMQANPGAFTCNQAGVGGALVEAVLPAPAMAPGGAGVGAGLGNPGAVGLGLPAAGGGPSPSNAELKALEAAVTQLQQLALDKDDKKKKDKDKGKRRKKSRKKSKKSKKKKKKSKRSSSSRSSSSRSSRSRSRSSSSTSSSSSGKGKPLKWREHGKDQKVSYSDLAHVDQLRLKKRGDLLAFAAKSPGALTAHFLAGIYARLSKGSISRSSQLREASAVSWAHQFSGLSEVRDQKEVLTLSEILDHINRREIARALDVLCQRIVAIQQAKAKGGSWEKAEALELVTNQRSLAASSMLDSGFEAFFLRAMRALEVGFGAGMEGTALSDRFKSLMKQLGGLARHDKFKATGSFSGCRESPSHVFPLTPMSRSGNFLIGHNAESRLDKLCRVGGNVVVACLNWMHGGQPAREDEPVLTAAHRRVHSRIGCALEAMVMTDEPMLTQEGLDQFLRQSEFYSGEGVSLALGVRGGVPERAADVPLAEHLSVHFPGMSKQVVQPSCLLLASRRRPRRVKRGFAWLAASYPELVKRNVKAGLHKFKKESQVAKHRGVKVLAGAFAVKKDLHEDRVITDPSVNQLLDPERLPRPKFAYIPALRCLSVPRTGVIAVSKRDARHYFHRLRIGKRWHRWLCGPPISIDGRAGSRRLYPASCSAPMGFGPPAGWAQGLTDVVTSDAQLPQDCRVHPDFVIPPGLPVWGSIIDDIWALEHSSEGEVASIGPEWLGRAESAWVLRGVAPNTNKSVDGARGEEIQGYYVHPTGHWVGLSLFLATYSWLEQIRKEKPGAVELPHEVLARYSSHKGVYTNLSLPWSVGLTHEHTCPLRRVRLPVEKIKWFHIGTPWAPSHITLGEADAVTWCAEDRLRRASDDGCRFVHPLDSAACVGAFSKGRSSSILINARRRRVAAVSIGGGHDVFYPWVPSAENPADTPSRWFEPSSGDTCKSELAAAGADYDLRVLPPWAEGSMFFIHLCSGPDRCHDLVDMVEQQCVNIGCNIVGIRIDPLAWVGDLDELASGDLLKESVGHGLLQLIHSGLLGEIRFRGGWVGDIFAQLRPRSILNFYVMSCPTFLTIGSLRASTAEKYLGALKGLNNSLLEHGLVWSKMNESEQDSFLAEWVLDGYEQGESRNMYGWALSAVQKIFPRVKLKTAWKVLDVWSSLVPVRQAPAAPPELIQAMVIMATLLNRPQLGLLILLCFVGLLRVREALALTQADLILQTDCVVLCLGLTKRGMEQKVVLNNVTVVHFVSDFFKRFPSKRQDAKIIEVSYSSALRWIRKLSALLGADDLQLTTHSFRRSGASELARQGVSLQDILLYGRWLSERAARDYIRKGEVAIFRARQMLNPQASQRIQSWAKLGVGCWQWFDVFYAKRELVIDVRKVTVDKLYAVERILFSGPDG